MLLIGRRDVSEGLGLGMEENELEEGEAYYQPNNNNNGVFDADSMFPYIDEKINNILGHFQKEFFEGGVSAENLGSKFGGYGSFLPAQPRSPPKVQSHLPQESPNQTHLEDARQNLTIPANASHSWNARPGPKLSYVENSVKREMHLSPTQDAEEFAPKYEAKCKPVNAQDQKSLKVRLKVGPDSVSTRNITEIYSGLGLEISPSPSIEDNPDESGGSSPEYGDSLCESPMSILQIMISPLVPGGYLLSPLPESLLCLTEKERPPLKDSKSWNVPKGIEEVPALLQNESLSMRDRKGFGEREKKMKSIDKNEQPPMEAQNVNHKDEMNNVIDLLEREDGIESLVGREFVSNALDIPQRSCSTVEKAERQTNGDMARGASRGSDLSKEVNKSVTKDRSLPSDLINEETSENGGHEFVPPIGRPNSKTSSVDKARESKKMSDFGSYTGKYSGAKGDKRSNAFKVDSDGFKGRKEQSGGSAEPPRQRVAQKTISCEKDESKMPQEKESKKKLKGIQDNVVLPMESAKGSTVLISSTVTKDKKKSSKARCFLSGNKNEIVKSHGSSVAGGRGLGDMIAEQADDGMDSLEVHFKDKMDSKLEVEKEMNAFSEKHEENLGIKNVERPPMSAEHVKAPAVTSLLKNGPTSDAVTAPAGPVVIEENWVQCDKCQKWRLLPLGTNPKHLPEKWLCSMLNWLTGMNKCTISEEETTKALNALYQMPVPESQPNLHSQCSGAVSGVTLADVQLFNQSHELSSLPMLSGGKKKHGPKDPSYAYNHSTLNSIEKNQHACIERGVFNDVHQLPLESQMDNQASLQHPNKLNETDVENHRRKQKEKHKLAESYPDGGNHIKQSGKHSKSKSKREANQDGFKTSKKLKEEGFHYTGDAWHSNLDINGRAVPDPSDGLLTKEISKKMQKHNDYISSKESNGDTRDKLLASRKKSKSQVQVPLDGVCKTQFGASDFAAKKRKAKEPQEHQGYLENARFNEHFSENRASKEEISESECRKKKKVRALKAEEKESSTSLKDGKMDKKGKVTGVLLLGTGSRGHVTDRMEERRGGNMNEHQLGQFQGNVMSQRALDGTDSLKRDLVYGQPSAAATSSSSKVSGSCKSRTNFQVKNSPVESVSSSPLRIFNTENLATAKSNILGKDDVANVGLSVIGSPRQCSDGEIEGGVDQSGAIVKGKDSSFAQHGSFESQRAKDSSRSKDRHKNAKSDFDRVKVSDSFSEQELYATESTDTRRYETGTEARNCSHYHEEPRDGKYGFSEKGVVKSDRDGKSYIGKKDAMANLFGDGRRDNQLKFGIHESSGSPLLSKQHVGLISRGGKSGDVSSKDGKLNTLQNPSQGTSCNDEKSSNRVLSVNTDRVEMASSRGKLDPFPPSGDRQEMQSHHSRGMPGSNDASRSDILPVYASNGDAMKETKHPKKPNSQNGTYSGSLRRSTPGRIVAQDIDAPSPVRKDSGQAAANALKEAKDLKHSADRLKNGGLEDSTGIYFRAALKFLHGASLLEPCNVENAKHGETTQSMQVYTDTAKLCEFCAHEYERCKEMAAAALAYKCVEVAHMRVIYSKQYIAGKDRHELQAMLQAVPPGESPSSSASDVDNLNNQASLDKVALAKGIGSTHSAGNLVIPPRYRHSMQRLLHYANHMDSAMEALRKSRNAFAAANVGAEEARYGLESISSVRSVLEFNFHDIEGLLHLVRLALEAISR